MSELRLSAVEAKIDNVELQLGRLCGSLDRFTETMIRHDENNKRISDQLIDHEGRIRVVEHRQATMGVQTGTMWTVFIKVAGIGAGAALAGTAAVKFVGG